MFDQIISMIPEQWRQPFDLLLAPIAWIPVMQQLILDFFLNSSSGWIAAAKFIFLLFPLFLWVAAMWCTQISLYTLPFRSRRLNFLSMMLLAWWDAARAVWLYWVGLFRIMVVVIGWGFTLLRLGINMIMEAGRQLLIAPFTMTGKMTKRYFQPGFPWIAFLMVVFWCLLEAIIFTYTLFPTVSEVLTDLVGAEAPQYSGPILYIFLSLLIMGSYACIQALLDSINKREYTFLIQMILVELFVMFFEVMFLYRELVDAITPWIAQQTGEAFRLGIWFTMSLATFGWIGIRGMTWFLFGRYGTPPLLAIISRQPMLQPEGRSAPEARSEASNWWRAPLDDFKREIGWLHEKGDQLLEYFTLPVLHVLAAVINFALILITSRPIFSLPFKSLKQVMETRELFASAQLQPKKVGS